MLSSPSHGDSFGKFSERLGRGIRGVMEAGEISIALLHPNNRGCRMRESPNLLKEKTILNFPVVGSI